MYSILMPGATEVIKRHPFWTAVTDSCNHHVVVGNLTQV